MRTAALDGRDPRELQTAGEMLALRGVHPDVEHAEAALRVVQGTRMPEHPTQRRSLRTLVAVSLVVATAVMSSRR